MISHPFHIHDIQFNILEIGGVAPPAHMQGWKDVLLVPPFQATAKFITRFEDHVDPDIPYMYHCHILTHEDDGMMGQFVVVEDPNAIEEFGNDGVSLYPNPANDQITIVLKTADQGVARIYDMAGRSLITETLGAISTSINVSTLSKGLYVMHVNGASTTFTIN